MQTLTTAASISKRKQACTSCRHRKKRCDGERPTCSLCRKWGLHCEYVVPAMSRSDASGPTLPMASTLLGAQPAFSLAYGQTGSFDVLQFPDFVSSLDEFPPINLDGNGYPTPFSGQDSITTEQNMINGKDLASDSGLPSTEVLTELVRLFFEKLDHVFPCFHQATFMDQVHNNVLHAEVPAVLYAMCSIAARFHPDAAVKFQRDSWYELAKFEYDLSPRDPRASVRTIQAALLILYHSSTVGDFSSGWLCLGKAWRQVSAVGLNRLDSGHEKYYGVHHPTPETPIEREEYRRTLWLLFMMDRNHSWPTGWPCAINELQFKIDFPGPDEQFQAMTKETAINGSRSVPFTRDLDRLISSSSDASKPLNVMHYLCVAHVLLGRVAEQIHSLHDLPHTPEYTEQCNEIDSHILKFRLSLPRAVTSILEAPVEARAHVIWINLLLNTMAILLHYRCAKLLCESAAQEQFTKAVVAARNTAQIIKDVSRISVDLLINCNLGSSLYIAACVLVMEMRINNDKSLRTEIDLFALVFERFSEVYSFLGLKYKLALQHDLERDMESILDLRERGFRGLLADCTKWSFVREHARAAGLFISS